MAAFGEPMPKLMIVRPCGIRGGLHRPVVAVDLAVKLLGEADDVVAEIREQHVGAELGERHPGVAGQPIGGDFGFGNHVIGVGE